MPNQFFGCSLVEFTFTKLHLAQNNTNKIPVFIKDIYTRTNEMVKWQLHMYNIQIKRQFSVSTQITLIQWQKVFVAFVIPYVLRECGGKEIFFPSSLCRMVAKGKGTENLCLIRCKRYQQGKYARNNNFNCQRKLLCLGWLGRGWSVREDSSEKETNILSIRTVG